MASEKLRPFNPLGAWRLCVNGVVLLGLAGACDAPEPPEAPRLILCCDGRGACLPTTLLTPRDAERLEQGPCSRGSMCVPDGVRGPDPPKHCSVKSTGAEGRCAPSCLPDVRKHDRWLSQDGCAEYERCVPCYDPTTGEATSACDISGDLGPSRPPTTFDWCCGNLGRCLPSSLLTQEEQDGLGPDTCTVDGALCVPADAVQAPDDYVPASCVTEAYGAEGRCLPSCLPDVARRAYELRADGCANGLLCVPCFDPLTSEATGACTHGADPGPTASSVLFDACCSGSGHCIPAELVPADQRSHLGSDDCAAPALCVPDSLSAAADVTLAPCTVASTGAEGRCAPSCLPEVAKHADSLSQDGCGEGDLCAPCFDPLGGDPTGVCSVGSDHGPTMRPVIFDNCCSGFARCLPTSLVPATERKELGKDSCQNDSDLCVPSEALADPPQSPEACTMGALGGAAGICLLECLPAVARLAGALSAENCSPGHLCVPCADPRTGAPSGVCDR